MRKRVHPAHHASSASALSDEDRRLFRETVGPVRRVRSDTVQPHAPKPKPVPKRRNQAPEWSETGLTEVPLLMSGDIMSYVCHGVQKKVLRRLRQGDFGIDAEIDLHGLIVDEAQRLLNHFFQACLADGCRCIHLIHGKGYRSEGEHPILKNKINLWLRQHPDVLAFCTARPADGGTGAVYVLLRDSRKSGRELL